MDIHAIKEGLNKSLYFNEPMETNGITPAIVQALLDRIEELEKHNVELKEDLNSYMLRDLTNIEQMYEEITEERNRFQQED